MQLESVETATTLQRRLHAEHKRRQEKWAATARDLERGKVIPIIQVDPVEQPVKVEYRPPAEIVMLPTEATIEARVAYPLISIIIQEVSMFYGISVIDILSSRRTDRVCIPRHRAMYLAKTLTLHSLPEIGRRFGGRDHTTVLYAVGKIEKLVAIDQRLADEIEVLKLRIADRVVAAVRTEPPQEATCNSTPTQTSTAP